GSPTGPRPGRCAGCRSDVRAASRRPWRTRCDGTGRRRASPSSPRGRTCCRPSGGARCPSAAARTTRPRDDRTRRVAREVGKIGSVEERAAGGAPAPAGLVRARLGSRRLVLSLEQAGVIGLRRRLRVVLRECGHVRAPAIRVAQPQPHGGRTLLLLVEGVAPAALAALDRDLVLLHDHGLDRSRAVLERHSLTAEPPTRLRPLAGSSTRTSSLARPAEL